MENVYYLSRFITEQCKEQIQTVLYRSVVFLPGRARNTNGIQNTPEGVVRMCCTGLLFSLPGSSRYAFDIQNSPEGDLRMYYTKSDVFFTRQCKEHTRHLNAPEGDVRMWNRCLKPSLCI